MADTESCVLELPDEVPLSYQSRLQSLADAERLLDELTQEKQQVLTLTAPHTGLLYTYDFSLTLTDFHVLYLSIYLSIILFIFLTLYLSLSSFCLSLTELPFQVCLSPYSFYSFSSLFIGPHLHVLFLSFHLSFVHQSVPSLSLHPLFSHIAPIIPLPPSSCKPQGG